MLTYVILQTLAAFKTLPTLLYANLRERFSLFTIRFSLIKLFTKKNGYFE